MPQNDTDSREQLAVERTRLANERTLLAYVRTALGLVGAGVLVAKLVPGLVAGAGGIALVLLGVLAMMIGVTRFRRVRRRLSDGRSAR
jgi:putative membrane protein